MSEAEHIKVVLRYFEGCNSGDVEVLLGTLTPDVVHYFLPPDRRSVRGADHLAQHWRKAKRMINPIWTVDHAIGQGEEVVTEWSCLWSPPGEQQRLLTRGGRVVCDAWRTHRRDPRLLPRGCSRKQWTY